MSNILAFVSIKGGVGKTTLALETASALANDFDKKVLLVDANFSAPNIGMYLDLTKEENRPLTLHHALSGTLLHNVIYEAHGIDVVPASLHHDGEIDVFKLKKVLEKYKNRYDFIILDSSPNHEELKPVIAAADKIFIVTSPDHVTLNTSMKAAKLAKEKKTPIEGIIVNRIRNPKHEYDLRAIEKFSKIPVVARIKDHKKMAQSIYEKTPITILDRHNPVSREVRNMAAAIAGVSEPRDFLQRIRPFRKAFNKEGVNRQFLRQRFYESAA
jgi:pilus assembly protein CpaE